ncbi:uncharacterized protein LOC116295545 [Actinia tenebrosa]|uniref:Uncharacterized protein LOC116295545 n=1 Tax=Actinia tenebrosa TaxID=6105 RepID=A0A6P8I2X4_ACTTE|nr:uncharacterized protein LOC116295545 [Actinia tenebrosa]
MKVICAGFSKTGTKTMASALRIFGYNVHDVEEQWEFHMDEYHQALESAKMPDFVSMYANVDAVTDSPAMYFFEEIFHAFPNSKVLLMIRDDDEVWLKSWLKTCEVWNSTASQLWVILGMIFTPTGRKFKRFLTSQTKIYETPTESNINESSKSAYRRHNERVMSTIPRDQLLVYNVKEGWKPLCEFLGVEVPDVPFPRVNMKSEVIPFLLNSSAVGRRIFKEVVFVVTLLVILLAVIVMLIL